MADEKEKGSGFAVDDLIDETSLDESEKYLRKKGDW